MLWASVFGDTSELCAPRRMVPQSVHPWYVGVQFHPEFKSTPWDGHPLFNSFIKAAVEHQKARLAGTAPVSKQLKAVA